MYLEASIAFTGLSALKWDFFTIKPDQIEMRGKHPKQELSKVFVVGFDENGGFP